MRCAASRRFVVCLLLTRWMYRSRANLCLCVYQCSSHGPHRCPSSGSDEVTSPVGGVPSLYMLAVAAAAVAVSFGISSVSLSSVSRVDRVPLSSSGTHRHHVLGELVFHRCYRSPFLRRHVSYANLRIYRRAYQMCKASLNAVQTPLDGFHACFALLVFRFQFL